MDVILASASPRRKQILKEAGYKFKAIPPNVREVVPHNSTPSRIVKSLALQKAVSVFKRLKAERCRLKAAVVVGADTIVVLKGKIIGKPKNRKDALRILRVLSGSKHYVYTGVALVDLVSGRYMTDYEKSEVLFRKLSENEIQEVHHKHMDKAGAYSVQEQDDMFVDKIKGDYLNVVGFPLKKFQKMINKFRRRL